MGYFKPTLNPLTLLLLCSVPFANSVSCLHKPIALVRASKPSQQEFQRQRKAMSQEERQARRNPFGSLMPAPGSGIHSTLRIGNQREEDPKHMSPQPRRHASYSNCVTCSNLQLFFSLTVWRSGSKSSIRTKSIRSQGLRQGSIRSDPKRLCWLLS